MTTLEQARALLQRGLSVFRIPLGSKVPTDPWKHWQHRLATDDELVAMFSEPSNIGIVTGAISGLVVVDADTLPALRYCLPRVPATPWRTRTSAGAHLYFRHPGRPVPNRGTDLETAVGPLPIHIRGDGGYVLAPGSTHPSGCLYTATDHWDEPPARLPYYDRHWLAPPPRPPCRPSYQSTSTDPTFLLERARRYLAAMPVPIIGHGSDLATFQAACRLVRGFELSPTDAESLLWDWCGHREGWTRPWVAGKVASAVTNGRELKGGLR